MRHVARKGLITVAAASGFLAAAGGAAHADASADGSAQDSPGIGSGNTVQAPVDVPVNVCGNSANVGGLLNPASGNSCANDGGQDEGGGRSGSSAPGGNGGGAQADGRSAGSPGVLSGNNVQAPVHAPVNVCGNSATVVGAGNAVTGNECGSASNEAPPVPGPEEPRPPRAPEEPGGPGGPGDPRELDNRGKPWEQGQSGTTADTSGMSRGQQPQTTMPAGGTERLAETGTDIPLNLALPVSGGLLLAGAVLYRRARAAAA